MQAGTVVESIRPNETVLLIFSLFASLFALLTEAA